MHKHTFLDTILKVPAFAWSICFLYWSFPIGALLARIRVLRLKGLRKDNFEWAELLLSFFGVQLKVLSNNSLYTESPCIYLCNHRSWADFFIDLYITHGRAQMMSRWMVFWVLPVFMISGIAVKAALLFKRQNIRDKDKFNNWIDSKLKDSPSQSLLVYPEGHRSIAAKSLPLKRGMLHYAYSRRLPVQIVITHGKERVLCEKTRDVRFGEVLKLGFAPVLHTSQFQDFESFFSTLQRQWDDTWSEVERADVESLQSYCPNPEGYVYSLSVVLRQLAAILIGVAALAAAVWVTYGVACTVVTTLGAWSKVVVPGLLLYTFTSLRQAGAFSSSTAAYKDD